MLLYVYVSRMTRFFQEKVHHAQCHEGKARADQIREQIRVPACRSTETRMGELVTRVYVFRRGALVLLKLKRVGRELSPPPEDAR